MVNANTDGGQTEPHRRDAARGGGRAPIRDQSVDRIRQIPKVIETGLLNVLQEFSITRKGARRCGLRGRREAFLGTRGQCRDLVKVRLPIDDTATYITEARRSQQART